MGGGSWTTSSFKDYSTSIGRTVSLDGAITTNYLSAQSMFTSRGIDETLRPYKVVRECCDTDEHPQTIPVILALDVTGSMGSAAMAVAKKLNLIMTGLYDKVKDVEFMIMGIGDLSYDRAPIQASQFESDVRIAEQLDKIYFEGGGGGNSFESYTAAWYFGLNHTKLDCWNRGKKGIIITMGDEPLNPYLPKLSLAEVTGDGIQADIDTEGLYKEAVEKFDIYHLMVNDSATSLRHYKDRVCSSFGKYLDGQHLIEVTLDSLEGTVIDIISNSADATVSATATGSNGEISW